MDEVVRLQKQLAAKDAEILYLRAELKRMQQVARRAGVKGLTIKTFDTIKSPDERINAMQAEISRLTSTYGSGSAFKGEYKSKYYSRQPSDKQRKALQEWNELQKQVGREAARAKKRSERALKSQSIKLRQSNNVATHEAVKSIMDLVQEGDERDRLREDPDLMYNLIDYTTQLAYESESNTKNLFTYNQVNDLFNKWESALDAQSGKPSPF